MANKKQLQQQLNRFYSTDLPCKELSGIIGVTKQEFRDWVNNHFVQGMTSDNYGIVWQLDHVVPGHLFDFSVQKDINICFNYLNIIPMMNNDNRLKSASAHFSLEVIKKRIKGNPTSKILEELRIICENEITERWSKYL